MRAIPKRFWRIRVNTEAASSLSSRQRGCFPEPCRCNVALRGLCKLMVMVLAST